jgi:hypothetical protein
MLGKGQSFIKKVTNEVLVLKIKQHWLLLEISIIFSSLKPYLSKSE